MHCAQRTKSYMPKYISILTLSLNVAENNGKIKFDFITSH